MKLKPLWPWLICLSIFISPCAFADLPTKGIYITQITLENTRKITYLIKRAKTTGINTFIIDFKYMSALYKKNIALVRDNQIRYVARIVVFPEGGHSHQVKSETYWNEKYALAEQAIQLGAQEIQLDYIRYKQSQAPSSQNKHDIHRVIQFFKQKLKEKNIPLQVAVFGIASFGESRYIGQHIPLFAETVDAICPMVYPSHFEPYRMHARQPYQTILDSLDALRSQFESDQLPFKLYPYIELSNYRYPLSRPQRIAYIRSQIQATEDADADGWYAWSANNYYEYLFIVLEENQRRYVRNEATKGVPSQD